MNKILSLTAACSLFAAPAAFAAAQTHHCDMNGTEVSKTHADCKKAGGKWAKGAPGGGMATSATPTNAPTANAGKPSPAPATGTPPARDPAVNPAIPANTPPTPNGNNKIFPPPGERTPGN